MFELVTRSLTSFRVTRFFTRFSNSRIWNLDANLYKILTGRLFKDNIKRVILSIHVKGIQLYKEFMDKRFWKESTVSIWAPLKKARLKRMKNSSTKAHYVTDGKLH